MYTRVDEENQPIGLPASFPPEGDEYDWYPIVMPAPRQSEAQVIVWEKIGGRIIGRWDGSNDPMDRLASREEINARHRELEVSPIMVFGEPFDCDEKSEIRMRDAIAFWDSRPLEPGVFEERELDEAIRRVIIWTKGDNTLAELTREQLIAIFNEMLSLRAVRGAILFARLRQFKGAPVTLKHISNLDNWLP